MYKHSKYLINSAVFASIACLALLGFSNDANSWGGKGHTAIGVLAVNQLQPDALLVLKDIVNPLTPQAMDDACNWPDVIRETEDGEWSGPLHYINIPRGDALYLASRDCPQDPELENSTQRPAQHCATEAIKFFAAGLTRPHTSREQRWQAFAWLCHLVADLHQPMHAGFADDRGGNDVEVMFEDEPMNLHHFWDTALINQQAGSWQYLVGQLSPFPLAPAGSDWSPVMVNDWTNESHKLAKEYAYPATEDIDETFAQQSWEQTQQQIRTAADHLALIINSELKPVNLVE